ncbi:Uncharacterised protein [Mycobacterium tuberculosis]|nr:Uncharacterised protein [Mycobacterium tuberculosis]
MQLNVLLLSEMVKIVMMMTKSLKLNLSQKKHLLNYLIHKKSVLTGNLTVLF